MFNRRLRRINSSSVLIISGSIEYFVFVFVPCLENLAPVPLDPIHLEGSLSLRTRIISGITSRSRATL